MKFKHVSYAIKRNSVSALNFCTGQLLTLFTGTFTSGASHIFLDRVFECLLQHGWPGAFHLVGMILGGILELVEVCTHDKLNVIWNAILRPSFLDIMLSHAEIVDAVEKPDDKEEESLTKSALVRLKYQSLLDVGESQGKALLGDCMHLVKWDKLRHTLQTMFGKVAHSNWMSTSQTVEVYIQEYLQVQKKVRQNAPS